MIFTVYSNIFAQILQETYILLNTGIYLLNKQHTIEKPQSIS